MGKKSEGIFFFLKIHMGLNKLRGSAQGILDLGFETERDPSTFGHLAALSSAPCCIILAENLFRCSFAFIEFIKSKLSLSFFFFFLRRLK